MCGHMWATHRQWNECHAPGCSCLMYRPKPRRPWPWFPHRPPAGSQAESPPSPQTAPAKQRSSLPGPTPAQAAERHQTPPGPGTTARVLRFRADLECGCRITHLLPRIGANSMHADPCAEHGWCGLCGWQIGAAGGGRYAYVWETCPAHDQVGAS